MNLFNNLFFSLLLIINIPQEKDSSLDVLCDLSSDIVIAKPVSFNTIQSENKKHIYTNIKFEVIENIKGNLNKQENFEMLVYGGEFKGIRKFVVDAPTFKIDEESLLFLIEQKRSAPYKSFYSVTEGIKGKYDIYTDEKDGMRKILNETFLSISDENKIPGNLFDQFLSSIKEEIRNK